MKRLIPFLLPFFFIGTALAKTTGKVVDYIIETVNGIPILYSDVKRYQTENKVDEKIALEELTQKALLLSEAKKKRITIPETALNAALENLAKANGYKSVEEFKKAVEKAGIPFREIKRKIKEQLIIQRLIDIEVKRKLSISPVEIDRVCSKKSEPTREVYYVKTENTTIANRIFHLLEKGEAFENATKICTQEQECEKGFLGNVKKGSLLEKIDKAIWQAKIKEPVRIELNNSTYILYVTSEKYKNCDRKKIENRLLATKYKEALKEYLEKLKKTAIIEKFNL
ncbi:SurA N-terminal domain-containing protein [Desulfurobacterium atlanticum]|uniref:Peptidyl-prolyl cis-trans isomerase SurA n=1 Tax=Desulfurobacterium atlanticum TaxID=240169 RepID=A0A238YDS8_9BACT|nr:SurA N-terminal domain-containing protein [Desulfurobacterium atlanticum]SNR68509.1 peptidyl-prolyl cis-trans isomerase SurA [Desulfurobacterium atlanticum]